MNDRKARWLALYALCLGDLMIVLDTNIVNVALPTIQTELGFSPTALAWVVKAYMLTSAASCCCPGRLGDLFGNREVLLDRRRVVHGRVASACALAPNAEAARRRPRDPGPRRRRRLGRGAGPDHGALQRPRASARRRWASSGS